MTFYTVDLFYIMGNSNQIKGEERRKPEYLWKGERRLNEVQYIALGSNGPYARQVVWGLEVPRPPAGYKKMKVRFFSSCNCLSLNLVTKFFYMMALCKICQIA